MALIETLLSEWRPVSFRFTSFWSQAPTGMDTVWRDLVGRDPDVDQTFPSQGLRRQSGELGKDQLDVQAAGPRLDVALVPILIDPAKLASLSSATDEAIETFREAVRPWFANHPPGVFRIAFGAVLMLPCSDRFAAYDKLQVLVPSVKYDARSSREVLYRVNRPYQSKSLPGQELNRITTWSAMIVRGYTLRVAPGATITDPQMDAQFVRLELDHSTSAEATAELDPGLLEPIFNELIELGMQNAVRGELG